MCGTCGCDSGAGEVEHSHTVTLEQDVLAKNDGLAGRNRDWLAHHGLFAVNLMSSPGAGKTTLLERTITELGGPVAVIEGDQETVLDADRIKATGAAVTQVNTGAGCHLDASMVARALDTLHPAAGTTVFIENVGNLVCPALFDLGEHTRAVVASVTEGADKPLKYPHMFTTADVVLLNKIDLLSYVDFELAAFERDVHVVNPAARVLPLSATRGDGLADWYSWLSASRPRQPVPG
ncbi:hydrogenase nickel incorporation protein HypB [Amycolatopsis sp. GM8]|uniref:hydrogenase nickel incorporation protein HypB n=1 Tax=Amycolatopsis sp. GM8 TaxID=2896530 RepID=UPI001F0194F3|nr:hydrogenase nickel incorporation protein HypB [Amycolatopsis sp. GM8]